MDDPSEGRTIKPLPYTGPNKEFDVKISDEEIEALKDDDGMIRYWKVFEWSLACFKNIDAVDVDNSVYNNASNEPKTPTKPDGEIDFDSLYAWQAKRMSNYLHYLIKRYNFKPRYFDPFHEKPEKRKDIEAHHIQRLYGVFMNRSLLKIHR